MKSDYVKPLTYTSPRRGKGRNEPLRVTLYAREREGRHPRPPTSWLVRLLYGALWRGSRESKAIQNWHVRRTSLSTLPSISVFALNTINYRCWRQPAGNMTLGLRKSHVVSHVIVGDAVKDTLSVWLWRPKFASSGTAKLVMKHISYELLHCHRGRLRMTKITTNHQAQ